MTTLHTLSSGSGGNAALLSYRSTHILLDAGISCRRIAAGLSRLNLSPQQLACITVSHCHSDHIAGLRTLLKKTACPILATPRTCRELAFVLPDSQERLREAAGPVSVDEVYIIPIPASHDAPGTCGWRLDTPGGSVGVLTDTGYVPEAAQEQLLGVDLMLLEANHDIPTLRQGPYPPSLKRRILGPQGHLCNQAAAALAAVLAGGGTSEIVLAHLSRECNTPELALEALRQALAAAGLSPVISAAPRDELGPCHHVRRAPCKR